MGAGIAAATSAGVPPSARLQRAGAREGVGGIAAGFRPRRQGPQKPDDRRCSARLKHHRTQLASDVMWIEAIIENEQAKTGSQQLEPLLKPDAILASNRRRFDHRMASRWRSRSASRDALLQPSSACRSWK